jgi:predicted ATP-grasp superfamily ATP-dependent carboligase
MLRVIIEDFKALDFEIKTLLDFRIIDFALYLQSDFTKEITKDKNIIEEFKNAIKDCKYVFIVAPEFSNILYDLTKIAKDEKKNILSLDLHPIRLCTSKLKTYNYFKTNDLLTPRSYPLKITSGKYDRSYVIKILRKLKKPIIIKPEDGVGAESIFYFEEDWQIKNFFNKEEEFLDRNRKYFIQEYISGTDLSTSIIINERKSSILSVNVQNVNFRKGSNQLTYLGGYTPVEKIEIIENELSKELEKVDFSGFKGYFGIDFIREKSNKNYYIEINPRLTTSYIGIRNITKKNPILLLIEPETEIEDIVDLKHRFVSHFFHLNISYGDTEISQELIHDLLSNFSQIISPPFSLGNISRNQEKIYSCFVATKAKGYEASQKQISHLCRKLTKHGFNILNSND